VSGGLGEGRKGGAKIVATLKLALSIGVGPSTGREGKNCFFETVSCESGPHRRTCEGSGSLHEPVIGARMNSYTKAKKGAEFCRTWWRRGAFG